MNLAFFRFCKSSKELILNVITTFFLSYKDHAMDDSNNNIIICHSLLDSFLIQDEHLISSNNITPQSHIKVWKGNDHELKKLLIVN